MSLFDKYEKNVYSTVEKIMGDVAFWVPSNGSVPQGVTAKVLFKNPTTPTKLAEVEYNPVDWQMEFYFDAFPNLKTLVDSGTDEVVTIKGNEYWIKDVITKWDGDISLAHLELKA